MTDFLENSLVFLLFLTFKAESGLYGSTCPSARFYAKDCTHVRMSVFVGMFVFRSACQIAR